MKDNQPWYVILKHEREKHSWSQEELAEKLETDARTVRGWEIGEHRPSYQYRRKLCDLYRKSSEQLGFTETIASQILSTERPNPMEDTEVVSIESVADVDDSSSLPINSSETDPAAVTLPDTTASSTFPIEQANSEEVSLASFELETNVTPSDDNPGSEEDFQSQFLRKYSRRAILIGAGATATGGLLVYFLRSRTRDSIVYVPSSNMRSTREPFLKLSYRQYTDGRSPGVIYGITRSPDGTRIASASTDATVHVWETSSGKLLFIYQQHHAPVTAVAWSPDGNYIASGDNNNTVHIWEAVSGKHIFTYSRHTGHILSVAWSPDGKRIASGGADTDKTVHVWDAFGGTHSLIYYGHNKSVWSAAWSPDGRYIASGSADTTVQVWNASSLHLYLDYTGHSADVHAVAWSPNGSRIVSGSFDKTVQSWEAFTDTVVHTYKGHTDWVRTVAWSPDGRRIASGGFDTTVKIWSDTDGNPNPLYSFGQSPSAGYVHSVVWLPDGKHLAAAREHALVQIWNIPS